jgi:uncharacterized membrane protein HdeD (DUF308 family)
MEITGIKLFDKPNIALTFVFNGNQRQEVSFNLLGIILIALSLFILVFSESFPQPIQGWFQSLGAAMLIAGIVIYGLTKKQKGK